MVLNRIILANTIYPVFLCDLDIISLNIHDERNMHYVLRKHYTAEENPHNTLLKDFALGGMT